MIFSDYGVVLNGEFQLELTDGSFTTLRTGEVVVLRGTQHAWHNKGTEWARERIQNLLLQIKIKNSLAARVHRVPHRHPPLGASALEWQSARGRPALPLDQ